MSTFSNWNNWMGGGGSNGRDGQQGDRGLQGLPGPITSFRIGTVSVRTAGQQPEVTIQNSADSSGLPVATLNFALPEGRAGTDALIPFIRDGMWWNGNGTPAMSNGQQVPATGERGPGGPVPTINFDIESVPSHFPPQSDVTYENGDTERLRPTVWLRIPRGRDGVTPEFVSPVRVAELAPGSQISAALEEVRDGIWQLSLGIPRGDKGDKGDPGETGRRGRGIHQITNWFMATRYLTQPSASDSGWWTPGRRGHDINRPLPSWLPPHAGDPNWQPTLLGLLSGEFQFLWRKETIHYVDGQPEFTKHVMLVAIRGPEGLPGGITTILGKLPTLDALINDPEKNPGEPGTGWIITKDQDVDEDGKPKFDTNQWLPPVGLIPGHPMPQPLPEPVPNPNFGQPIWDYGILYVWSGAQQDWIRIGRIKGPKGDIGVTPDITMDAVTRHYTDPAFVEKDPESTPEFPHFTFHIPQGIPGQDPFINDDGYWQVGDVVTDFRAEGPEGNRGKPQWVSFSKERFEYFMARARKNDLVWHLGPVFRFGPDPRPALPPGEQYIDIEIATPHDVFILNEVVIGKPGYEDVDPGIFSALSNGQSMVPLVHFNVTTPAGIPLIAMPDGRMTKLPTGNFRQANESTQSAPNGTVVEYRFEKVAEDVMEFSKIPPVLGVMPVVNIHPYIPDPRQIIRTGDFVRKIGD